MPSEPLDPCPVCGKPCTTADENYGTMCTECEYNVHDDAVHRRLCAEVALARVVMEWSGTLHRTLPELDDAIARVREASK